jgi:hypothetical protein
MKQFFKQLFNKKTKTMVGRKVKLVHGPANKPYSHNSYLGNGEMYIVSSITKTSQCTPCQWYINNSSGKAVGWVYEWEMEDYKLGIKELEQQLSEAQTKLNTIQSKIDWINETGSTEFSEEEFKVHQTLKLLENTKISMFEKSKLIAELIKK